MSVYHTFALLKTPYIQFISQQLGKDKLTPLLFHKIFILLGFNNFLSLCIMVRKIIHIDMDAFYASVEQRDNPSYRGKPLIVGGRSQRGVVSAASYEARAYGIHSAMPVSTALRKCPSLINVPPRIDYYQTISSQIHAVFLEYTDKIEPLSLDEAFLDVTENFKSHPSATMIAQDIRNRIFQETQLAASAGISYNKFLAKVASDINKPNGQFVITPEDAIGFIKTLPIERFFGIGKATAKRMHSLDIKTGGDLQNKDMLYLTKRFGKSGTFYYYISRGIDNRPVNSYRERKSIGAERTFKEDIDDIVILEKALTKICEITYERVAKKKRTGKTVCLKIKFEDFTQITRSKTVSYDIASLDHIHQCAFELFSKEKIDKKIRLLGVSLSNLNDKNTPIQLKLPFKERES